MTLTDQEKTAYRELSIIFLDRDVFDDEADLIARNLSELDFSIAQLERMLRDVLFPILYTNFICFICKWAAFEETALFRDI